MTRTDKLKGLLKEHGYRYADMAEELHMAPKTFSLRMKTGVFGSDEIEILIDKLQIENPLEIFFVKE